MKKAIKRWGVNDLNIPQEYIQEALILNDNDLIPNGYELATEQEIEDNIALYGEEANLALNLMQEEQEKRSTIRFSNSNNIDDSIPYNTKTFIKKEVGLENNNTVVTEYYESYTNNEYINLVVREEKEYQKVNNSPLFNLEILRIKYYNKLNEVAHTKIVETPLALGYQMSITARMQELKVIKAEEYIVSQIGYELGLPLHIQLIDQIKDYERLTVQPLYDAIQALNQLTVEQKNIVNSILFGE